MTFFNSRPVQCFQCLCLLPGSSGVPLIPKSSSFTIGILFLQYLDCIDLLNMIFHDISLLLQLSCACSPPFCSVVRFLRHHETKLPWEREVANHFVTLHFRKATVLHGFEELLPHLWTSFIHDVNGLSKSGKVFQHFEFIVCIGGQTGSAYILPLLAGWYKFFFLVPFPLHFTSFPSYHHILWCF